METKQDRMYREWDSWIDTLFGKTANLCTQRDIYNSVREIVRNNPTVQTPGDFFDWISVWYASSMSVSVRQLAENQPGTISYRRLLEGIKDHPKAISRTRFKQNFVDGNYKDFLAAADFDRYVGTGREHIDVSVVKEEIRLLKEKTSRLTDYVNNRVAHHSKNDFDATPKHSDLDDAIDFLVTLHRRYHHIFKCSQLDDDNFVPNCGYDWKQVFRLPWLAAAK
jgi:hypothetical protein